MYRHRAYHFKHSLLHVEKERQAYIELGADYFKQRKRNYVMKQSIRKLETLGFQVTLEAVGETVS